MSQSDRSITSVTSRVVYDSASNPTIEVEVSCESGSARSLAPRGSTTGQFEATVLEDASQESAERQVLPAIRALEEKVAPALIGQDATEQNQIDSILVSLCSDVTKSEIGGNVCVATSSAVAKLGAAVSGVPLFTHLSNGRSVDKLPKILANVIDGGKGPSSRIPGVEILFCPTSVATVRTAFDVCRRVFQHTLTLLHEAGYEGAVSHQGALSVPLDSPLTGLELINAAANMAGLDQEEYFLGLDLAMSEAYTNGVYSPMWRSERSSEEGIAAEDLVDLYLTWTERGLVRYLEDGLADADNPGWALLTNKASQKAGSTVLIAGDDLFASSRHRIKQGAASGLANTAVIKPNQVGTITETVASLRAAEEASMAAVVSQRTGETDDALITHLAVAQGADYLKAGGIMRMDRVQKYNELARIQDEIAAAA